MYTLCEDRISRKETARLLRAAKNARIGLIGDLCLDIYWIADMKLSELSRETPHYPLPVVEERYAPGGAGNAAANIAAFHPGIFRVIGVVGDDWRGMLLRKALREKGIDPDYVAEERGRMTNTYCKPIRCGISEVRYEDPRLDFEGRGPISEACEEKILDALENAAADLDVICVSDQMKYGCVTPRVRERLCQMGREGMTVIVDSRDRGRDYHHVTLKPNEIEASRAFGDGSVLDLDALSLLAEKIRGLNDRMTLMTLGGNGCFVADEAGVTQIPACPVEPPIDFCGAGDTFLAGFATMLAAGATPKQAAQIACLCSAVTIKKLGTTGTASPEEVLAAHDLYFRV